MTETHITIVAPPSRTIDAQFELSPGLVVRPNEREWSSGICDCAQDCGACCCACCCPCCFMGMVAHGMGENCCLGCCVPGGMMVLRTKLRTVLGIEGSSCIDCCCGYWCGLCVACQLYREEKAVGLVGVPQVVVEQQPGVQHQQQEYQQQPPVYNEKM